MPKRIPILYLIFGVLILVSVGPLVWYGNTVVNDESDRLVTNEKLLQNTITRSVEEELAQRQSNLLTMMGNLASAITVASGSDLKGKHLDAPELRALLEKFVSSSENISKSASASVGSMCRSSNRCVARTGKSVKAASMDIQRPSVSFTALI